MSTMRGRGRHADQHEDGEQPLLDAGEVGDRAEDWRDDRDERDRGRRDRAEPRGRLCRLEAGRRIGGEERRKHRRDDGGEVGGVSPVVPGPCALLGSDEADIGEERAQSRAERILHVRASETHECTETMAFTLRLTNGFSVSSEPLRLRSVIVGSSLAAEGR